MEYKKTLLAAAVAASAFAQAAVAAPYIADARSNGMGNTGVVSADFLTSAFHNPALGALYRDGDDVGLLIPAIGINVRDSDESVKTIEDLQDLYDQSGGAGSPSDAAKLDALMDDLEGNKPINATGGAGLAVAVPMDSVSLNFFVAGFTEVIALANVAAKQAGHDPNNPANVKTRYDNSTVGMVAFGTYEYGLALSKVVPIQGQDIAFGVTPKIQRLFTYSAVDKVDDFKLDNYKDSEVSKSAFNLDLGAAWVHGPFRAGLTIKDLLAQEIDTELGNYTYELGPQFTVGGGYVTELFTVSADLDLTAQKRFKNVDDDTQFFRIGVEGNAWNWAQLRAGYEMDMKDTVDNAFTMGIGISPGDVVSLDIAGSYAGSNQFGASANLAFTF